MFSVSPNDKILFHVLVLQSIKESWKKQTQTAWFFNDVLRVPCASSRPAIWNKIETRELHILWPFLPIWRRCLESWLKIRQTELSKLDTWRAKANAYPFCRFCRRLEATVQERWNSSARSTGSWCRTSEGTERSSRWRCTGISSGARRASQLQHQSS